MKALSDLIQEKREELDIQGTTARVMKPEEAKWLQVKTYVRHMPTNYEDLFMQQLKENPQSIKKTHYDKHTILTFSKEVEGYEIMVEIIEDSNKNVKRVRYCAFNNEINTVYLKETMNFLKEKN